MMPIETTIMIVEIALISSVNPLRSLIPLSPVTLNVDYAGSENGAAVSSGEITIAS